MRIFGPYYFDYAKVKGESPHNPLIKIHRALTLYNDYAKNKSKASRTLFLEYADGIVEKLVIKANFGVWPYYCVFSRAKMYGCKVPWVSALSQGQGISALVRAYDLAKDDKYLTAAEYALRTFITKIEDGGVLSIDDDDNDYWYEEYACPYAKPSGVLNGFIFALLGIHDFYLLTKDDLSRQLFERGISTLNHHLQDFGTNCPFKLTYYDRQKHITTFGYHRIHIKQMEILHQITRKDIFRKYQLKWERLKEEWITHTTYRWLSKLYYLTSGHTPKASVELFMKWLAKKL